MTMIKNLLQYVNVLPYVSKKTTDGKLNGKTIVFTGTLTNMTRAEAKVRAEELGAKVLNSVSSKLNYLVAGEDSGSKLTKAKELGITILTEEQWLEMVEK